MRKTVVFLLVLALLLPLSASVTEQNRQKIYSIDSDVYRAMRNLYISEGMALPSTTGPWSAAELDMMLERAEKNGISEENAELYQFIKTELNAPGRFNPGDIFGFTIGLDIDGEMYVHTNKDDFASPDDYARSFNSMYGDWNRRAPLLSVPLETWIGNNIYGYSSFDIGAGRTVINLADEISGGNTHPIGTNFMHNILLIPPTIFSDVTLNFPYRAFGSIGGDWWNISVGRDRLSWGPGVTGNLIVGDQLPYHDNARFTAFTPWFKYTFSMSSFIHPMNYHTTSSDGAYYFSPFFDQTAPRQGLRMLISHRLEWRIVDKVNMALTESIMYQNEEGSLDFLVLSPTAIFHNYYIRGNANSIASLEIDFTPVKHWNIYGEIAIDEFRLPGEFSYSGPPSASGYIVGTRFSYPLNDGVLYGSVEGAYTDPYLYLRDDGDSYDPYKYGNSFIVGFPEFVSSSHKSNYDLNFVGYRYGGDAIVADLRVGYEKPGKWLAEGEFMYMAHGTFDVYTRWDNDIVPGGDNDPMAPSDDHPDDGSYLEGSNWQERNAASHTFVLTLKGAITPIKSLDVFGRTDLIAILNNGNIKGETAVDLQFTLGVKYSV